MEKSRVLVFTATLNEKSNIGELCRAVLALSPRFEMLVVDDNSADGTGHLLRQLQMTEARLHAIHRHQRLGLGTAHKLAMLYAIENGYDTLITMDADWSHDPNDIPRLLEALKTNDFVTGSRYMPGGRCDYWGYRRTVSIAANRAARLVLRAPLHEFTTSFRAYRIEFLKKLNLNSIRARGYSFFLEVAYKIYRRGGKVSEIPIHFHDRKHGDSKIPKNEIFNGMYRLMTLAVGQFFNKKNLALSLPSLKGIQCYLCHSPYLIEVHAVQGSESSDPKVVRSTTLEPTSKPQVVACLKCGLDFVPNRKQASDLHADVEDEMYLNYKEGRYRTFEKSYKQICRFLKGPQKLLEIGCYCGYFLDVARRHQIEVEGVEPSGWAAEYAKKELNLNVHRGTLADVIQELSPPYSSIVMWDVLEHLDKPLECVKAINPLLTDGGYLFLSALDTDNWFPKLKGKPWPWIRPMYKFYFRMPALKLLLKKSGFEIVHVENYFHYISVHSFIEKLIALTPTVLHKPLSALKSFVPKNHLFIPFRFGDIKLYVCQKTESSRPLPEEVEKEGVFAPTLSNAEV